MLLGMYFFLSNEVVVHEKHAYSYIMFLAELGGVLGLFISVMKFVVEPVKFNYDLAKII